MWYKYEYCFREEETEKCRRYFRLKIYSLFSSHRSETRERKLSILSMKYPDFWVPPQNAREL